jgi:hypothetical protein
MTPPPSSLASRAIGVLVAPGATRPEWILSLSAAAVGSAAAATHAALAHEIGSWRLALVAFVAFDMFGGAVANCTDSCKRHWHTPSRTRGAAFGFVAGHVVHLALVAAVFRGMDAAWFGATTALLLASAALVLAAPEGMKRPSAAAALALAVLVDFWLGPTPGLEWFATVFFFKLLVAHLLAEGAGATRLATEGAGPVRTESDRARALA